MFRVSFNRLLILFVAFIVAGCGNNNESSLSPELHQIQGRWVNCMGKTSLEIVFRRNNWITYFNNFADSNCITPTNIEQTGSGTFSIGDTVVTESGVTARELDVTNASGGNFYDIFYINQNMLYLGDDRTGDTTSAETRPTDIDFNFSLEKRPDLDYNTGGGSANPLPVDSGTGSSDTPPTGGGGSGSDVSPQKPIDLTNLEGAWSLCDGAGFAVEFEFNVVNYAIYYVAYAESNCLNRVDAQMVDQGNYIIGGSIATASGVTVDQIDRISLSAAPHYDLYYIDQGQLYFGDYTTGDGTTAETRPTEIDLSQPFVKIR